MPQRPCGGCTKKGYALEQCIDGCEPCRRARDRCEGGKPCTRCTFMKIECLDEPSAGPLRHDPEPAPARSPRPGGDRVKSACQNCRRDNKKVSCPVISSVLIDWIYYSLLSSVKISGLAAAVLRGRRSASMLVAVRS